MSVNREDRRRQQKMGIEFDEQGNQKPQARRSPSSRNRGSNITPSAAEQRKTRNPFKKLKRYLQDVRTELTKVDWPTKPQVWNLTGVVVTTLILMMGLIFVLDLGFAKAALWLFK